MNTAQLNLARKWRSKNFDEIVGQELTVKMLKNSLYLDHYFPVYLFAGQKGCGKTSTARVFATALNCEQLPVFQKNPKSTPIPCLECASCQAMRSGKHPDFMEIDAASNTGVDNVRQIIDAASLLPLMGRKKIYLIDEAHMLSKAAFNAFLKLLEEPPLSVIFMLATTDTQKIIETVRSRCFQLFFKPVDTNPLVAHLEEICAAENIAYEANGLAHIVQETGGCVRDALNLLEQVRFAHSAVTADAVTQVLGHVDDAALIELYALALHQQPAQLLQHAASIGLERYAAEYIWRRLTELTRALMWLKYDVLPLDFVPHLERLNQIVPSVSGAQLNRCAELLYRQEGIFLKTTAQHAFCEMVLLQIAQPRHEKMPTQPSHKIPEPRKQESSYSPSVVRVAESSKPEIAVPLPEKAVESATPPVDAQSKSVPAWDQFISSLNQLNEPLVSSVFMQGTCLLFEQSTGILKVEFSKELLFFKDSLDMTKDQWMPLLIQQFGPAVTLESSFTAMNSQSRGAELDEPKKKVVGDSEGISASATTGRAQSVEKRYTQYQQPKQSVPVKRAGGTNSDARGAIDISDANTWKKTHLLLKHFPGIVREIQES